AEVRERRDHRDIDPVEVDGQVAQRPRQLLDERERLEVIEVHLPVARDERGPVRLHHRAHPSSTARPGRTRPSRNSSEAPPPVEMCPKSSSAKPRARTAAAESPPPTTVS